MIPAMLEKLSLCGFLLWITRKLDKIGRNLHNLEIFLLLREAKWAQGLSQLPVVDMFWQLARKGKS